MVFQTLKMPRTKVKKQVVNQSTKENAAAALSDNYEGLCKFFSQFHSYSISDLKRIVKKQNLIFVGFHFYEQAGTSTISSRLSV